MKERVLVSIVNWVNEDLTIECIESVLRHCALEQDSISIVDNSADVIALKKIPQLFPSINIIRTSSNLGFAAGHYESVKYAKTKGFQFIWLLNNDCFLSNDALEPLLKSIKADKNIIAGSIIANYQDSTIQYADGYQIDLNRKIRLNKHATSNSLKGRNIAELHSQPDWIRTSHVSGSSMFFSIDLVNENGFMDFSFFLYYEETDWCFRLWNEKGIKSYVIKESVVYHKESSSFFNEGLKAVKNYYVNRNAYFFSKRYFDDHRKISLALVFELLLKIIKLKIASSRKRRYFKSSEYLNDLSLLHSYFGIKGKTFNPNELISNI
ncbi:glycosyltransferase family 2 protein [Fulvivirgaceae bacterium LMO-SS25]